MFTRLFKKVSQNLKEIIIVYKTHFDIGYSELAKEVVQKYRTEMIDHTLDIVEKYHDQPAEKQFVWTIPGWPMRQMLWEGQTLERKQKIQHAFKAGNLTIHALPFTTHLATMDLEEIVMGMKYSADLAREYGFDLPRGAKTTDVPEQSWILPTILKKSGVNFYHMGINDATTMPDIPLLFWWEGPDGSRLLTMATNTYGTWKDPRKNWTMSAWLAILQTGDNQGPPSPDAVKKDLDYYMQYYPKQRVKIGRLEDFFNVLSPDELKTLPVIRGDMPDCWIHGVASNPLSSKWISDARPLIRYAQFFSTLNSIWNVKGSEEMEKLNVPREIAQAYEKSILWSEHTWGVASQNHIYFDYQKKGDITIAVPKPLKSGVDALRLMQDSWTEHSDYASEILKSMQPLISQIFSSIASDVSINGEKIVVFNCLPWNRSDMVTLSHISDPYTVTILNDDGNVIVTFVKDNKIQFTAENVPSLGYKSFLITRGNTASKKLELSIDSDNNSISSPWFKAQFDPVTGNLISLFDSVNNFEIVEKNPEIGFGYYYERYSKKDALLYAKGVLNPGWVKAPHGDMHCRAKLPEDQPSISRMMQNVKIQYMIEGSTVKAIVSGELSLTVKRPVEIIYTLYEKLNVLDIHVHTDHMGEIDAWPASSWLSLPLNIENPQFRVGNAGFVADPKVDFITRTSKTSYWVKEGVSIFNNKFGIGVSAKDTQLISLGEPGVMKFDGGYKPQQSRIYINLINNVWHTNFCDWWTGSVESNIRLWSFTKYDNSHSLIVPAENFRYPMLAFYHNNTSGSLPKSQYGITISEAGILLTAFERRSGAYLLRLWNLNGEMKRVVISLPKQLLANTYQSLNLRDEPEGTPKRIDDSFIIEISKYSPKSLLIR